MQERLNYVVSVERYETARVLITVKTYPNPSAAYEETVCTAGVRLDRTDPEWIRLYPIRFRNVEHGVQFEKYELIDIGVAKHPNDPRPESFRPNQQSLEGRRRVQIAAGGSWPERREFLGDLIGEITTCDLIAANRAVKMNEPAPSLGLIKPEVLTVTVRAGEPWKPNQLAKIEKASQPTLFGDALRPLEPMPYIVEYRYRCRTEGCGSHTQKVLDWELGQAGRRWRREYGDRRAIEMIRRKYEDEYCAPAVDLHFYIGNQHQRRESFSILGVWFAKYPPENPQLSLLDLSN
jgi:hypothetical protein